MTCPVCKRELAPTLSICFTCGTMVNDTVREELETKIGRCSNPLDRQVQQRAESAMAAAVNPPIGEQRSIRSRVAAKNEGIELEKPVSPFRVDTSELGNKKTSPTLVEFQHRNPNIPDWRLQLQNAVRQRKSHDGEPSAEGTISVEAAPKIPVQNAREKTQSRRHPASVPADPRIENALKRIETSRDKFFVPGPATGISQAEPERNGRSFPFGVVTGSAAAATATATAPVSEPIAATVNTPPKPRLVSALRIEKGKYDTNKLPKLIETPLAQATPRVVETPLVEKPEIENQGAFDSLLAEAEPEKTPVLELETAPRGIQDTGAVDDEQDDLAPISSRLTAGVFDLIFGIFASAIVISPFMMAGGNWFSVAGVLAGAAIFGIVMFIYLTLSVGYFGRTIGMKLFSLELIDAEENEYPTFHQAAVNAAVFLVTLPFLGVGFLPAFFNEERRAAHDLFSGTVLVREV